MLNRPQRNGWARKLRKHRPRLTGSAPIIRGSRFNFAGDDTNRRSLSRMSRLCRGRGIAGMVERGQSRKALSLLRGTEGSNPSPSTGESWLLVERWVTRSGRRKDISALVGSTVVQRCWIG
jgi:hypothetical protein